MLYSFFLPLLLVWLDAASAEEPLQAEMFPLFVPSVLCGVEPGHAVQRAAVEVASGTLEEHRVREANWTLQQGQVGGSTPRRWVGWRRGFLTEVVLVSRGPVSLGSCGTLLLEWS